MRNDKPVLHVESKKPGKALGDLFGIFFEDLNHAADGGLYAELVQNRAFEFCPMDNQTYHGLTAWETLGNACAAVRDEAPFSGKNPHYLVLEMENLGDGIQNIGYNSGIPVSHGEEYDFSCYVRGKGEFTVSLEDVSGKLYAQASLKADSAGWKKVSAVLTAEGTSSGGRLCIRCREKSILHFDFVSLFPPTYKNRPNGMRRDIAELLDEMKPKFMRFPGGCLVHCGSLDPDARDSMYRWKNTIGPVEERPARCNNWKYNQSFGIGYYEYFLFCEDIGTKPLPVLPGGYNPHKKLAAPLDELQPWIDDALDLIEFANGDSTTQWGKIRAELGHPEPFDLEYIGIGNEEVGEDFFVRYPYFHRAIREKYPQIKIINTGSPFAYGSEYERGWESARKWGSDYVDEHYYQSPEWFLANIHRYDHFDPDGPKVFLGEYATWGNTYYNALVEAAYMTGLEKAEAVGLACYAPMLANVDYVDWTPDMIYFNNRQVFGSANYYIQKLFMNHQGDYLLPVTLEGMDIPNTEIERPIVGQLSVSTGLSRAHFYNMSVTNTRTGETKSYPDCTTFKDKQEFILDSLTYSDFVLEMNVQMTAQSEDMSVYGNRGFSIHFGKRDRENQLCWEVGGWQNQDAIIQSILDGRGSCLSHKLYSVQTGETYRIKLEVCNGEITGWINGDMVCTAVNILPVIEPIYYSSSIEHSSGDIILKVVNVSDESVDLRIETDAGIRGKECKVYTISGHQDEDENSFEWPALISPQELKLTLTDDYLNYRFDAKSLTIFRIEGRE